MGFTLLGILSAAGASAASKYFVGLIEDATKSWIRVNQINTNATDGKLWAAINDSSLQYTRLEIDTAAITGTTTTSYYMPTSYWVQVNKTAAVDSSGNMMSCAARGSYPEYSYLAYTPVGSSSPTSLTAQTSGGNSGVMRNISATQGGHFYTDGYLNFNGYESHIYWKWVTGSYSASGGSSAYSDSSPTASAYTVGSSQYLVRYFTYNGNAEYARFRIQNYGNFLATIEKQSSYSDFSWYSGYNSHIDLGDGKTILLLRNHIVKINGSDASIVWQKKQTTLTDFYFHEAHVGADGNIYWIGTGTGNKYYFGCIDTNGNILWSKEILTANATPKDMCIVTDTTNDYVYVAISTDTSTKTVIIANSALSPLAGSHSSGGVTYGVADNSLTFTTGSASWSTNYTQIDQAGSPPTFGGSTKTDGTNALSITSLGGL